ncbi:MAG: hypothetical protein NT164_04895 [Verrucomicrobiae bacterium]|nr:hypothetical protein [Verrucomicrobiae bacterium]
MERCRQWLGSYGIQVAIDWMEPRTSSRSCRGEIKFVAPSEIETATSRSKQDGLNLVRLAIFRDYEEAGLRHFDRHFNTQLMSEHPITVGQLMDFVDEENKVNPKAFYLSSIHSLHELIVGRVISMMSISRFKLVAAHSS